MKTRPFCFFALLFLVMMTPAELSATHIRSGEITYKRLPPFSSSNFTYSITVTKYFDVGAAIADRCVDTVYFGDGQKGVAARMNGVTGTCCASIPCGQIIVNEPSYVVKKSIYSIVHTYTLAGSYRIMSVDFNRTAGISNISNSGAQPFVLEAVMNISANLGANSSPQMSRDAIDRGLVNNTFLHNTCSFDEDGDSLSYELYNCVDQNGQMLTGFSPVPNMSVDATTGMVSWISPQLQGKYQVAIKIKEWRRIGCWIYQQIGYVMRDLEIVVNASSATNVFPQPVVASKCIKAGDTFTITNNLQNMSGGSYACSAYGLNSDQTNSVQVQVTTASINSVISTFVLGSTACASAKFSPQMLYLVYESTTPASFLTWYLPVIVKIIPPAPIITTVQAAISSVSLQWQSVSSCSAGISQYNIYRKFGALTGNLNPCLQGAAPGFSAIGSVNANQFNYTDNDLWTIPSGTKVNYLVTAVYDDCKESYADTAVVNSIVVGLNEPENFSQKIFLAPNPSSGIFRITGVDSPFEIEVFGVDGQQVLSLREPETHAVLDLSAFSPGLYFVTINGRNTSVRLKAVKD